MAASLLGTGGVATVPSAATAASPACLYSASGASATADGGAVNVYSVVNLDATNWLWIRVVGIHKAATGIPILPGERLPVQMGFDGNNLVTEILAWSTLPNVTTTANANLLCCGGFQGQR